MDGLDNCPHFCRKWPLGIVSGMALCRYLFRQNLMMEVFEKDSEQIHVSPGYLYGTYTTTTVTTQFLWVRWAMCFVLGTAIVVAISVGLEKGAIRAAEHYMGRARSAQLERVLGSLNVWVGIALVMCVALIIAIPLIIGAYFGTQWLEWRMGWPLGLFMQIFWLYVERPRR